MTPEISELVRELRELNDLITDSRISDAGIGMRVRTWKEVATLADTIQRLSERCDAGWQPIETAPFVSAKRYMLTSHHRIPFVGFRYYENGPWLDEHGHFQKPTHWRELPDTSCIDVVSGVKVSDQ